MSNKVKCCRDGIKHIGFNKGNTHPKQRGGPNDFRGWYLKGLPNLRIWFCPFCSTALYQYISKEKAEEKIMTNADLESMMSLRDKHAAESSPAVEKNFKAGEMISWVYAEMISKKSIGELPTLEELYDKFNEEYKDEVGEK